MFLVVPPSSINLDAEIYQAITHTHKFHKLQHKCIQYRPSQTRLWSRRKPNCYGHRNKKQKKAKVGKNRDTLKPSWAFVETKMRLMKCLAYLTDCE